MQFANRISELTPSPTLAITAKAKELKSKGIDVISLGAGEPDFNTPDHIIKAAVDAMNKGQTKYTPSGGIPELKQAVINKFKKDNGLVYNPKQIIITLGAKHALYTLFQVICNPGDEVIIPIPYWVSYPEQVKLAEAKPVYIEGKKENHYKFTSEELEQVITSRTKALILNSPSNPAGTVYSREELMQIAEVCEKHDILIVSDEIYEKLIYDGIGHFSIAGSSDDAYRRTIVINGLSKPYSMTGWRIGYAAGNEEIISAMTDIASHSTSNPVSFAQYGAIEALEGPQDELLYMKDQFASRRDILLNLLKEIPDLDVIVPQGAFYLFIDISKVLTKGDKTYINSDDWAEALLEEAQVAVIPGTGFGMPNFIRISYATSVEQLQEGFKRIKDFII